MKHFTNLKPPAAIPPVPQRLEDLDVPEYLVLDLAVRHVHMRGTVTIHMLAELLKLPPELAENIFRRLNEQQLLEVRRMTGDDYIFSLSPTGRRLASERAAVTRYVGPIPVSLARYTATIRAQAANVEVTRESLQRSFSDIVVTDAILDDLGPALISQRSIFLYGPSGTGKTTISERLMRVFEDAVAVPYAVEVDGQIVTVADPSVHEKVQLDGVHADPRWMLCRRPFLAVGGELITTMLDLTRDEAAGTFVAPLQMKANNGILLIDDFGRQMMSPRDLLNRWIVPLDRRVDFLSLGSGGKFDIPFELLVVFSTNLEPNELADEAFLRRIPNKILIGSIEPEAFDRIFEIAARGLGLRLEPAEVPLMRELCLAHSPDLRPCYPRDICQIVKSICQYERRGPEITRAALERAVATYFV